MPTVYIGGQACRLSPSDAIGKGGEADVYDLGNGTVAKVFKGPKDPDYTGNPMAQQGAKLRIEEHQTKLPAFPKGLPDEVVTPMELVLTKADNVAGYTMRFLSAMEVLLRYGDRRYREQGGIDGNRVVTVFRHLHKTVMAVHGARPQIVIGDFNDLNVLVDDTDQGYLVDADSMQYGGFPCRTFTVRFVDPLCCNPGSLVLTRGHNVGSDWYAYVTMLFQSLLYVGPYGGVHRPKNGPRLQHDARVLQRVTVFDDNVIYPKPALHYGVLPDELLDYFHRVYQQDERGAFPLDLLGSVRWTTCSVCGTVHARPSCPGCAAPGAVKEVVVFRGNVKAAEVFRTEGRLVCVAHQNGKLHYLYYEEGEFRREDNTAVTRGQLDPELRYRIAGDTTILGKRQQLLVFDGGGVERVSTDTYQHLSLFDANASNYFWIQGGQLVRNGQIGAEYIGDVLAGRTLFWTGERLGFGFYQAGELTQAFVFTTSKRGLHDQVPIPTLPGQLIDATCVFSDKLAWFMVSLQYEGRLENRCYVVDERGTLVGQAAAGQEDDSWLAEGIRGRFAAGPSLFAPTDQGIVRVESDGGNLRVAQEFPDTEPFVDATSYLLSGDGGIYVISGQGIKLLTIK